MSSCLNPLFVFSNYIPSTDLSRTSLFVSIFTQPHAPPLLSFFSWSLMKVIGKIYIPNTFLIYHFFKCECHLNLIGLLEDGFSMMTLTYISGTITPKAMVQECPYIIVYSHIRKYQGRCYKKGCQTNNTVTISQVLE